MSGAPPVPLSRPALGDEEWLAVREVLESGWVTQGPKVVEFERVFGELHGVPPGVATTSCTTALHLALAAMGVGPGDEVVVPAFTWVSTANVVVHLGATPVFADVDPDTFNVTPAGIAAALTPRTRAVVPVHLFGLAADIPGIRAEVGPDCLILEDAACAAGARLGETWVGGLGDAAAFSFHPRKSVTTGEGGMITSRDPGFLERCRVLRNHGASVAPEVRHRSARPFDLPDFAVCGFNYRLSDILAAIGLVQLAKLNRFIDERAAIARAYNAAFADLDGLVLPAEPGGGGRHAWQSYVVRVEPGFGGGRDRAMVALEADGISTRPGTVGVHMTSYYANRFGLHPQQFPGATLAAEASMALPLSNTMSEADVARVIAAVRNLGR
jgi:perosamine synthetase